MLILSLVLFGVCLLVIGVAFSRGLSEIDEILVPIEPDAPSTSSEHSA